MWFSTYGVWSCYKNLSMLALAGARGTYDGNQIWASSWGEPPSGLPKLGDFITKGFLKVFLPKGFLALFGGHKDFWQSICHETTNLVKGFSGVFRRFSCPFYQKSFWKGQENLWARKPLKNSWKTIDQICGFMTYGLSGVFLPPKKGKKTCDQKGQENLCQKFSCPFFQKLQKRARKP